VLIIHQRVRVDLVGGVPSLPCELVCPMKMTVELLRVVIKV
jgi:hypothetical protein